MDISGHGSSRLPKDEHFLWIATEGVYVVLYPVEGKALIKKSKILMGI
jgi:hypothetical protein